MAIKLGFSLLLGVSVLFCGCSCLKVNIPATEAKDIAHKQMREICASRSLNFDDFSLINIASNTGAPWIFDFETKIGPKRSIVVIINDYGGVETSVDLEKQR